PTTTVLLDTRAVALDADAFEHAVEAAGSVAEATVYAGRPARVVILGEDSAEVARLGAVSLLDRLALAERTHSGDPVPLLEAIERTPPGGVLGPVSAVPLLGVCAVAGGSVPAAAVRAVRLAVGVAVACGLEAAWWARGDLVATAAGVAAVAVTVGVLSRPGAAVLSGPYRL